MTEDVRRSVQSQLTEKERKQGVIAKIRGKLVRLYGYEAVLYKNRGEEAVINRRSYEEEKRLFLRGK